MSLFLVMNLPVYLSIYLVMCVFVLWGTRRRAWKGGSSSRRLCIYKIAKEGGVSNRKVSLTTYYLLLLDKLACPCLNWNNG